jgi:hypothetical protein
MHHVSVIQKLIEHTARDFTSYFAGTDLSTDASRIIHVALTDPRFLMADRQLLEWMILDTEDDGRWEASYALNTGAMMLGLIDYLKNGDENHYHEAVTLFFDTVDFKVHQDLESRGVTSPNEQEIAVHPLMVQERAWFESVAMTGA